MKLNAFPTTTQRGRLIRSTALLLVLSVPAAAEDRRQGCELVGGVIPEHCYQANEGQVVAREVGANTEDEAASPVGDLGFSITIDPVDGGVPRRRIAGTGGDVGTMRDVDQTLEDMGVQVTYDGLGARPQLNVSTNDMRRSYVAGDAVTFRAFTNYPAWIEKAEIRIRDRNGAVQVVPVQPNGVVDWAMPANGDGEMEYVLRVYDAAGRYDETVPLPLSRSATRLPAAEMDGPIVAAGEAEDRTARRGIPIRGGAVTITGLDVPAGTSITVMGEPVIMDMRRGFVVQRILPPGDHGVRVGVGSRSLVRDVEIPEREIFATGIVDLTIGRDLESDVTWDRGRIAGFAQGVLAGGTTFTVAVDTRERELSALFRDFGRKDPDQTLRGIKSEDVWVTTGDDSRAEDLAPTSGKIYARVDHGGSHLMWGDFKPTEDLKGIVRSDRALYGIHGTWQSDGVTGQGEPRYRFTGYAAQPDSLAQRDIFRGTGGSSYFLSRRDIQSGSETLIVQVQDPVSGRIVDQRRLVEGRDYRIDYVQGVVILNAPLSPSAGAGGLVTDRPLGDYNVNLVAQYEYVPTTGEVDGLSAGARGEVWLTDSLRFGLSGATEGSGLADNKLVGGDILFQRSENTYLRFDIAQSEGPGFGSRLSLNGGLEIDPDLPSPGVTGSPARGMRLEGRLDLEEFGGQGYVAGYFDRREAGFSSPELDIAVEQKIWGLDGEVKVGTRTALTFGADMFEDVAGKTRNDARVGVGYEILPQLKLEAELSTTDRVTPGGTLPEDNGQRTDLGARLTWSRDADLSVWLFGQATLRQAGGIGRNDRLGFGVSSRLSDALTGTLEVSDGSLGIAGRAELAWAPNASSTYTLGYRLDPSRLAETGGVTGSDEGSVVFGANHRINDRWTYTAENSYSALGSQPSMQSAYGVSYTPSETWSYDFGLITGRNREADGTTIDRQGLSFGARYAGGEDTSGGIRVEYRLEDSDNFARVQDRETLMFAGFYERQTSENWRFIASLDAIWSEADADNVRDGRYAEARLGYAYRPVDDDRLNALISYTYLYDLPGADQVNVDGDIDGPQQRSHILNSAISYDLNQQFTLGAKYGYRYRAEAPRTGGAETVSEAHLGVIRLDYHVVHNWDIMVEARAMGFPRGGATDYGALMGVYRDFGDNLRIGAGYNWGGVSDDLRSFESNKQGVSLNVIGKF